MLENYLIGTLLSTKHDYYVRPTLFAVGVAATLLDMQSKDHAHSVIRGLVSKGGEIHVKVAACLLLASLHKTRSLPLLLEIVPRVLEYSPHLYLTSVDALHKHGVLPTLDAHLADIIRCGDFRNDCHDTFMLRFRLLGEISWGTLRTYEMEWIRALEQYRTGVEYVSLWLNTEDEEEMRRMDENWPEAPLWESHEALAGLGMLAYVSNPCWFAEGFGEYNRLRKGPSQYESPLDMGLFRWLLDDLDDDSTAETLFYLTLVHRCIAIDDDYDDEHDDPYWKLDDELDKWEFKSASEAVVCMEAMLRSCYLERQVQSGKPLINIPPHGVFDLCFSEDERESGLAMKLTESMLHKFTDNQLKVLHDKANQGCATATKMLTIHQAFLKDGVAQL